MSKCYVVMCHEDNWEGGYSSSSIGVFSSYEKAQNAVDVLDAIAERGENYTIDVFEMDELSECTKHWITEKIEACEKLVPLLDAAKGLL